MKYLPEPKRGEGNPRSILKEKDVILIINKLNNGEKICNIVRELSIKKCNVNNIKNGTAWKHLTSKLLNCKK